MSSSTRPLVYMVYRRQSPDGDSYQGLSTTGNPRTVIQVKGEGFVTRKLTTVQIPHFLADMARKGFKLLSHEMFFNDNSCEFSLKHPDFQGQLVGSNYVLFTEPPDLDDAFIRIDKIAAEYSFTSLIASERDWMKEQMRNSTFLVAMNTSPLCSLIIAELAISHGWPLTSSRSGCPVSKPSTEPVEWNVWLQYFFAAETIAQCQNALGWTAAKLLQSKAPANYSSATTLPVDFLN